ncbi:MAG: efflux RND transporter periplasmic adaptor subunit [Legionellales bacterium]|nr:efflux RND transporter periplasmic adaptor subunit [Legionellales bacterium]
MVKRMLVLWWQYIRAWRYQWALWMVVGVTLLSLVVHCARSPKPFKVAVAPIIYQGPRLIVPENSALRSVVHVEAVHPQAVVSTVVVPATVISIPAKTVAVFPPLSGQIAKIFKTLGQTVKVGEPLYALVSPDLAQAISERTTAEATYDLAKKHLKRQRELAHYQINSVRDLEQAESGMIQAAAELYRCVARLKALHINDDDQDTQGHLMIRSPINGVVTAVSGGVGSYWSDLTQPVMTIADLSRIYLVASAQEHDLPDFFLGQEVQVVFERLNKAFVSNVDFINPILDPNTRTVSVGLAVDNPNNEMRPNMFAQLKFHRRGRQRIVLPMTAVVQRGFDSIVFVEVAPWQFEPRIVNVGLQLNDNIEIESGLADQERVAMTGGIILND